MSDNSTQPKDQRVTDAEIAKAEADARKAAAEALSTEMELLPKEVSAGRFTAPTAPPPLATVAAYRSVGEVGQAIAARLPASQTVWIVPDGSFQSAVDIHLAVTAELKRLTDLALKATKYVSTRPGELATELALAVAAAPVLMSLFSTSRTVTSADVVVGFSPLAAAVSAAAGTSLVHIWGLTPPPAANLGVEGLENARDNLDIALTDARSKSASTPDEETAKAEAEVWKAVLVELTKKDDPDPVKIEDYKGKLLDAIRRATTAHNERAKKAELIEAGEQLIQTIDEVLRVVTGTTGAAIAGQAAQGAALKDGHVLVLQPSYTGAESTFEDVKLRRDRAQHVGSTVVTWHLIKLGDGNNKLESGIQWAYTCAETRVGTPEVTWGATATDGTRPYDRDVTSSSIGKPWN